MTIRLSEPVLTDGVRVVQADGHRIERQSSDGAAGAVSQRELLQRPLVGAPPRRNDTPVLEKEAAPPVTATMLELELPTSNSRFPPFVVKPLESVSVPLVLPAAAPLLRFPAVERDRADSARAEQRGSAADGDVASIGAVPPRGCRC